MTRRDLAPGNDLWGRHLRAVPSEASDDGGSDGGSDGTQDAVETGPPPPSLASDTVSALAVEPSHVASARLAATFASLNADAAWARYMRAVERNADLEETRRELAAASAHQVYAWAVYHCAVTDAAQQPALDPHA